MKKIIITSNAPTPIGAYNQAILVNDTLYTSGQIALCPNTGNLVTDTISNETQQVMQNIQAILGAAEMTFENVVKTSIFLSDINTFPEVNKIYETYFNNNTAPARETVEVANLPKLANIEISVIAVK